MSIHRPRTPSTTAILDALNRLYTACTQELPARPRGTRGHDEYRLAQLEALRVLRASNRYGEMYQEAHP